MAVALPQTPAVVGATAALVESLQFNAFDTTRTTFASSPSSSSSSSWSSSYLPSSSSSFQGVTGAIQQTSLTSSMAYPTSITTTMSGYHNTKTSRIMSNINSISPTQTLNMIHTTFRTRDSSRTAGGGGVRSSTRSLDDSGISGYSLVTQSLDIQKNSLSSYTPTRSSGLSGGRNVKRSKNLISANSKSDDTSRILPSSSSSSYNNNDQQQHQQQHNQMGEQQQQQHFPLDFTFSKNHWTNSGKSFAMMMH